MSVCVVKMSVLNNNPLSLLRLIGAAASAAALHAVGRGFESLIAYHKTWTFLRLDNPPPSFSPFLAEFCVRKREISLDKLFSQQAILVAASHCNLTG